MNVKFSNILAIIFLAVAIVLLILLPRRNSATGPRILQVPEFQLANADPLGSQHVLPPVVTPPSPCDPIGPVSNVRNTNVNIEWNAPTLGTVEFYRVSLNAPLGIGIIGNPEINTTDTFVPIDDFVIGQGNFTVSVVAVNACGDESTAETLNFSLCDPPCSNGQTCESQVCVCSTPQVKQVILDGTWQNGFTAFVEIDLDNLNFANMQWEIATSVRGTDGQLLSFYFDPNIVAGILGGSGNTLAYPIPINQSTCETGNNYGCPADGCNSDHGVQIQMSIRPINNCGPTKISGDAYSCAINNYCELGGNSATPLIMAQVLP